MNQPRNTEHTINDESQWRKTMKKLDSKLQKQRRAWPKILNTTRKYNKDENSAYRYRFHNLSQPRASASTFISGGSGKNI